MKTAVTTKAGEPSVIEIQEVPGPELNRDGYSSRSDHLALIDLSCTRHGHKI